MADFARDPRIRYAAWALRPAMQSSIHLSCAMPPRPAPHPIISWVHPSRPGDRGERIEAAVVAGGRHITGPHEAWIAADPFNGGFRVLITGANGFERTVTFALDDDPAVIAARVREAIEE